MKSKLKIIFSDRNYKLVFEFYKISKKLRANGERKMDTEEYIEYLFENYNEILKDIEQPKFELESFKGLVQEEMIVSMNFSSVIGRRVTYFYINIKIITAEVFVKEERLSLLSYKMIVSVNNYWL